MFTIGNLLSVLNGIGPQPDKAEVALGLALYHEDVGTAETAWQARFHALMDSDDYDEMARLTGVVEAEQGDAPPLLFDGEPVDLSEVDWASAPRPQRITCSGLDFPNPTVQTVIRAQHFDPDWGSVFAYHIVKGAMGISDEELRQRPQRELAQVEEALGFLLRRLAMGTIASRF